MRHPTAMGNSVEPHKHRKLSRMQFLESKIGAMLHQILHEMPTRIV